MNKFLIAGSALAAAALFAVAVSAAPASDSQPLLTARFDPRAVVKVEAGDFHFLPGQPAPVHTHLAPAVGIVTKGTILYQVEGEPLQVLKAGDAFYEPVGPRILRFDNGSQTEEAVFIDTNWERAGDPFIHFDSPPAAKIDRRTMTTALMDGATISAVDVRRTALAAGGAISSAARASTVYGYVTEGALTLKVGSLPAQRVESGQSFLAPQGTVAVTYTAADGKAASLVTFAGRAG